MTTLLVGIECECGASVTRNIETSDSSFQHQVKIGGKDVELECACHKRYRIHPQSTHIHVVDIN